MKHYLLILRATSILLPQLTLLYFIAGTRNWLWGFNHTDEGLMLLLGLMIFAPLLCLVWMIVEVSCAIRQFNQLSRVRIVIWLLLTLLLMMQSIGIDLYILSHARM